MQLIEIILIAQGALLVLMTALWFVARARRDMGWVDFGWSLGVGLAAVLYAALLPDGAPWRRGLVAALGAGWSLRLAIHILRHRLMGPAEDARYARLRAHWGVRARYYVPALFLAQAPLALLFSLPLLAAMRNPAPGFTAWDAAGLAIWIGAVAGEALADRQLERFRARPDARGRTCREGLWNYSRHPNYFFEWIHWFAYVCFAAGAPYGWIAWLGPVLMLVFLFGLTGIPHTERQALARRGADYRRYQQTTSVFIPWFKRREAASC